MEGFQWEFTTADAPWQNGVSARVPSGPFKFTSNPQHRFAFIQGIINSFWKKWTRDYFPSLIIRQKWHTAQRNMIVGDIVLMQDPNQIRGQWKLVECQKFTQGKTEKFVK